MFASALQVLAVTELHRRAEESSAPLTREGGDLKPPGLPRKNSHIRGGRESGGGEEGRRGVESLEANSVHSSAARPELFC